MTFREILDQVRGKVRDKGRVTYRALKREFTLDDDYVADVVAELIDAEHVAQDEDGKVLVWVGADSEGERAKGRNGKPRPEPLDACSFSRAHPCGTSSAGSTQRNRW